MAENLENKKSEAALREEKILEFWRDNKTFEKSLTKEAPNGDYIFYDGPPFATGLPHYGHILGSTVKDVIGRYKTMRGYRVPRRWGWDCHGLPIENIVEKDLGIAGKKEIEAMGIDKFVEYARSKVLTYVHDWKKTVDRMGRWVDFDNSYKTMDNNFIESVWWALGELNKKELLYEGVRVLAYCPRCETPIANSEIAMDNSYKDITDISVYVKFKVAGQDNTYLLAWTTTPWTLPGNTSIAVNEKLQYVFVKNNSDSGGEIIILAKDRLDVLKDKFNNPEVIKEVSGGELVGLSYEPVFDYYKNATIPNKENIWKVWHADFVTVDMGTGIAHEAPAFGEEDMELAKQHSIPFIRHVEPNGVFSKEVTDFAGVKVKPKEDHQAGDVLIIKYLAHAGKLFAKEKIVHSYPHCYRCETPLLYYALSSWFVNIQKAKRQMMETAKDVNWIPSHLKEGRFHNIMENAPDWTISRNRYWASPLPIWKSESGKMMFVNSLEDLKAKTKKSANTYFVVRHGQAESNEKSIVNSNINSKNPLTEQGRADVRKNAEALKQKFDYIFCSPLQRTRETVGIIADVIGFDKDQIIFDERLREVDMGDLEGKPSHTYRDFISSTPNYFSDKIPNGESQEEIYQRMGEMLYSLEEKYQNKKILIVSHGDPVKCLFLLSQGSVGKRIDEFANSFKYFDPGEIRELPFTPLPHNIDYQLDFHRPYIDAVTLVDEEGDEYKRIPEVIDCWFESGSMPFAQDHFPFENPDWKKKNFPAGFVAEYIAQTRTWFYYTHTISAILFGQAPFENVVTTGTLLAEDGNKMSKSKNNFPDPFILFDKYGVDALRLYLMASPLMKGEDASFSEKAVQEISSKIIGRLFNVLAFYELYRDEKLEVDEYDQKHENVLDQWILSRLSQVIDEVTKGMDAYDLTEASRPLEAFVDDLSTWHLRRSRERIKDEDVEAKQTLYFVLKNLIKIMAPITPFGPEDIWLRLKNENDAGSVHLSEWPKVGNVDQDVLAYMEKVRKIASLGLEARQKSKIQVRQPLQKLEVKNLGLTKEYIDLIKDELNVKDVVENKDLEIEVALDSNITSELKQEGNYREFVRAVQDLRKKMGLTPSDAISLTIDTNEEGKKLIQQFEADLKKVALASKVEFSGNDGEEIKIGDLLFKVKIDKIS